MPDCVFYSGVALFLLFLWFYDHGWGECVWVGMLVKVAMDLGRLKSLTHGQITITTCCFIPKIIFTD